MSALERSNPTDEQTEMFLRFSRRGLMVILLAIVFLGATVLAVAFWPGSRLAQWPARFPLLFPILMLVAMGLLRVALHGRRWSSDSPEVQVILNDEFRRANLFRAQRAALVVVLVAQVPLGMLLARLPAARAVLGMAGITIALGISTVIALFLVFDRE